MKSITGLLLLLFIAMSSVAEAATIKARAVLEDGVTTVKVLINHPMETGYRTDKKTGEVIPAHYIQSISARWNGVTVFHSVPSIAIAKNPYFAFKFNGGNQGDSIEVSWSDNMGGSDSEIVSIK